MTENFSPKKCGSYESWDLIYGLTENIFFKNRGYYSSAVLIKARLLIQPLLYVGRSISGYIAQLMCVRVAR